MHSSDILSVTIPIPDMLELCPRMCHMNVSIMTEIYLDSYLIRRCDLQLVENWQVDKCHCDADKCLWTHYHGILSSIHIHLGW